MHGVVLRRRDSGENDRKLTLFTLEAGKIDAIAKGARKAASRLAGSSDPLTASVLTLAFGKRNEYVTQAQPLSSFRGMRSDYSRLSYGLALVELYDALMPAEQPLPEAYELLLVSLATLETHPKATVAMAWCELRLLELSGFMPSFDRCTVCGKPVAEANAFLSPHAGGYVCDGEAGPFTDRFRTRAEILYGLARTAELEEPPTTLKFAEQALIALLPFWRQIAGLPLPAGEACVGELRHPTTETSDHF